MADSARTTLLMLSGGIDSTYALHRLLTRTDDSVLAHHVHFVNEEGRHEVEGERCRAIVAWCQENLRAFRYSESLLDHRGLAFFGYDMVGVGFEAGLVSHAHFLSEGRMPDRWTIGTCLEEGHNEARFRHVEACVAANCWPEAPPPFFLPPLVSKRDELLALPQALRDFAWTCRRPVMTEDGPRECGTCKTCRLMAEVRASL